MSSTESTLAPGSHVNLRLTELSSEKHGTPSLSTGLIPFQQISPRGHEIGDDAVSRQSGRTSYESSGSSSEDTAMRSYRSAQDGFNQNQGELPPLHNVHLTSAGTFGGRRRLGVLDVISLIINKMVGTGIFTTPVVVLNLAGGKGLALLLWSLGGVYCCLSLVIYLDYASAMPFNGGELIYLNKVWGTFRGRSLRLLPAVVFSGFFVSFGHTAGNAIQFAREVLLLSNSPNDSLANPNGHDAVPVSHGFDRRLVNTFAVGALCIVCLLHYFSSNIGLVLNKALALFKITFLLYLAGKGLRYGQSHPETSGARDFVWQCDLSNTVDPSGWISDGAATGQCAPSSFRNVSGFIYVIYSFSGWENAFYVAGELGGVNDKRLRWAALVAVLLVTLCYSLAALGFYYALTTQQITSDAGMVAVFAKDVVGSPVAVYVCIALSAFGNLAAVVYTSSKVKQAIALNHFLPCSTFFAAESAFQSPGGAIMLHFIVTGMLILLFSNGESGYYFVIGLFATGQVIVGIFLGIGRPRLTHALIRDGDHRWRPILSVVDSNHLSGLSTTRRRLTSAYLVGWGLAFFDIFVIIATCFLHNPKQLRGFFFPVALFSSAAVGFLYWCLLYGLQGRLGDALGWKAHLVSVGTGQEADETSGVEINGREDHIDSSYSTMITEAKRDGAEQKFVYLPDDRKGPRKLYLKVKSSFQGPRMQWWLSWLR